jgi:CheY-like chemotaxis protein
MIALIEDEAEKGEALKSALLEYGVPESEIHEINNVRDAVLSVKNNTYDAIILDVSLPTFSPDGMVGSAGRAQQQSGGLEVLRALKFEHKLVKIVIITQYPDIIFEGKSVELTGVSQHVNERYQQNVIDAILYREADPTHWKAKLKEAIGALECGY